MQCSPCRNQERSNDAAESEQGEEGECDQMEDHGGFALAGSNGSLEYLTSGDGRRSFPRGQGQCEDGEAEDSVHRKIFQKKLNI